MTRRIALVFPWCFTAGLAGSFVATPQPVARECDHEEARQIDRARRNDPSAVEWLLARYRARVIRLAAHILRQPDEAEDVAQEAFIRAFRNLNSFRDEGAFYTWLYRIVVRVCLDRRGRVGRRREGPMCEQALNAAQSDTTIDELETRMVVERLMDRLTPALRATLVLRELEGLEYGEIANVLGIPVGLVRWRLHTARKQFQDLWSQAEREDADA